MKLTPRCVVFSFARLTTAISIPAIAIAMVTSAVATAGDWTAWRGPNQNGTIEASGLIDKFNPRGGAGSNVVWKSEDAAGISTPVVMNGRLFTIVRHMVDTPIDAEKVICLDASSGDFLWQNITNVFLSDVPAERVGWSNVTADVETDSVFALSACCLLQRIDAKTGETVWSHSLSEEYGMLSTYGGRTNTPAVFENLIIISGVTTGWDETARPAHRFLAFDKFTGELVWLTSTRPLPEDTTYSTPVFANVDGKDVMIAGSGDGGLHGFEPRTGALLWSVPISRRGLNTSAVVDGKGNAYIGQGEENPVGTLMGAVVRVDVPAAMAGSNAVETWRTEELIVGKSSPLLIDGRVYVVEDSSKLHVLDAETGEEIGDGLKLGTSMRGSLIHADGKIYACTGTGIFYVLKPADDGVEVVSKVRLPKGHDVGGSPIVVGNRIYLPTTGGLFCLANEGVEAAPATLSIARQPDAPLTDTTVARLQIVPSEAIVEAGKMLPLKVWAYNAAGQPLENRPNDLQFTVTGNASVDAGGNLVTQASEKHIAAVVTVTSGDRTAVARYRIIPSLPWSFDFSDHEVPVTWIGARYRHEARDVDGKPAIVKITTIPKGTRSQTWFGPTDLAGYTVTADVQAAAGAAKMPDIGLIAQRYTLDMMGESQQLQIRTWTAQLRMAKSVPFQWNAGTWYRLKFTAAVEGDQAVLRAKAWPRDDAEPKEWMLTATDDAPNRNGSPGLFGNSTNAEIAIENVTVEPNP
ncbi:outer membrane biogenesis protein BamB [Rubripirellula tenax]|uniref:Outer membrane biogenesis protein BamB n=1 Tax=Rubripirellula tenax TaxID=2528015 RepID=A0A5C6EIR8_9BACT|nr:PQQ-binding-like beta-propeller repeat protein [Rubripirellula tenax]TWU48688.1 outer membrane biogenesis protein BamB [Rubripirellula tenax]